MHEFLELDRQLFIFLNNLGSPEYDHFWKLITNKWIWVPFYGILLFILTKSFKLKSLFFIIIFVAVGITITDQLAGIFKELIKRLRPCHDPSLVGLMRPNIECGGTFGFYSAHASSSFFLATFLAILLKNRFGYFPYFLFIWACVVSYSRIYLGVHYPFDVGMGALVGFLLGGLFATLAKKTIYKN
ncbi:phosphatase PAP2 family protein [Frigoriflavimonas asaccharolytica]|uniref:Undecaprenyl-diphosphatase n=1 Tax=Frigoriflavimonas asaccharolytica TaxID=2735899 RepID=A0A8J8G9L6_9FLAO|nr:phosphatase PAP2 family protein [Frigoriflavimonas asaccharolytica]NRS92054.1 undecaprenyl-diphosphatase [Frigoriflavimonas asaccharolytica]